MAKRSNRDRALDPREGLSRRTFIGGVSAAVALHASGCRPDARRVVSEHEAGGRMKTMPTIYLPHGGGPWPWTPAFTPALAADYVPLRAYLEELCRALPGRPTGIVVVSAHWQAPLPTVITSERPTMLYDYHGFPADTYAIRWDAPGSPQLAATVRQLLSSAGIESAEEQRRGFDHGTFVPMKLAFPSADIPTIQLSLDAGYDPEHHLAMGRALSSLREQGVLIIGSGMSWEDFRARDIVRRSNAFDEWFQHAALAEPQTRDRMLANWTEAPHARAAHPHEEHLLPMMVAAGAAGADVGRVAWNGSLMGIRVSAVHFGQTSAG
ncbi:MAG: class III extradiol ring-cleavage dioxygenase [Labilithrix sp.]